VSTQFLRNYIDIINEAEQSSVQLDEEGPYSQKQINWVIKYNDKFPIYKVDPTTRKVRWSNQLVNMDVQAFEKVGLNIWDKQLRQAVTNAVLTQLP
jgi:hypothetical protein